MAKTIAEVVREKPTSSQPRTRMRVRTRTQLRSARKYRSKESKQRAFLAAYAIEGTITRAGVVADVPRHDHHDWMKEDPSYPERFREAEIAFADRLENAVTKRAIEGELEYIPNPHTGIVRDEKGEPIMQRKFNAQRDIALLRAHKPERYREDKKIELTGPGFSKPEINIVLVREVMQELRDITLPSLPEQAIIDVDAAEVDSA